MGIAGYYHNPQGRDDRLGSWIDLQPLTTELEDYSNFGVAVPMGMAFHFTKNRRHRFGMDLGWRLTSPIT
ncbi:MAG: hypothetical protein R2810_04240 [Flavobacteriales bacterium]